MRYLIAYVSALLVFGAIDASWLTVMGRLLYRPTLEDILVSEVRLAPALAFYLLYPVGIVFFAVLPALRNDSALVAFINALLFGAIAYATYDLTNYATLRNWNLQLTVVDIAYGAVVSGIASVISLSVLRFTSRWIS